MLNLQAFYQVTDQKLNQKLQKITEIRKCRICGKIGDGDQIDQKLITPCRCKGQLRYVRQGCLKKQLNKAISKSRYAPQFVQCQKCKTNIEFTTTFRTQCNNCDQVKQKISQKLWFFIVGIIVLIVIVIMLIVVMAVVSFGNLSLTQQNRRIATIMSVICYVILPIIMIAWIISFIRHFFVKGVYQVDQIFTRDVSTTTHSDLTKMGFMNI